VRPTLDQEGGVQKPGVHDRGPRAEASLLQRLMKFGGSRAIGCRADHGFDLGDQGGRSSSYVSVRCTVEPTHGAVCVRASWASASSGALIHCAAGRMLFASRPCSYVPSH
jgi:hypothetical protein